MVKSDKSYSANPQSARAARKWLLVDADGKVLGRLAADVAAILRGKHKPIFTPHVDCGDHVVVINADRIRLTGDKNETKTRYRHSTYPGGLKEEPYGLMLKKDPARAFRLAVRGMLPRNNLGRMMLRKLKVYAGAEHPHSAQGPVAIDLPHTRKTARASE
ncbi:MAG: 50S ribosomal protein L13 [Armatimonadetes bacterium]|nr:50S ribosomal protein L13 [Armatimonadota bacterium]NIM23652.1 50S ribosomal protein L13 [Armatimonadota bacterium]NIM67522.1 50S ribosomal protein L13 [Armatimonadota bacterium]NIM76044.1 50S ribosomal protein L13 [Armatimonadota bacterium]NIN05708.1 50S ribosomal protein L13 [Armatimonadota bacterium]